MFSIFYFTRLFGFVVKDWYGALTIRAATVQHRATGAYVSNPAFEYKGKIDLPEQLSPSVVTSRQCVVLPLILNVPFATLSSNISLSVSIFW